MKASVQHPRTPPPPKCVLELEEEEAKALCAVLWRAGYRSGDVNLLADMSRAVRTTWGFNPIVSLATGSVFIDSLGAM